MAIENLPTRIELTRFDGGVLNFDQLDQIIMYSISNARILDANRSVYVPGDMEASDIYTSQGHVYPVLVRRVFEIAFPFSKEQAINPLVSDLLKHEGEHAAAAYMLEMEVFYAIQIRKTRKQDGSLLPAIWGGVIYKKLDGSYTTVEEEAFIVSAPEKLSERDIMRLGELGVSST